MFACIFFKEDSSLSVVGKNNKDLELNGEFTTRNAVKMKWTVKPGKPKTWYHGTIVAVGDNEDSLTKFATKANNKILKDAKPEEQQDSILEKIINFNSNSDALTCGKRPRIQTEKLKQSLQQEETLSPKKKSKTKSTQNDTGSTKNDGMSKKSPQKNPQEKQKTKKQAESTPTSKKNNKKKCETATALFTGKEMFQEINTASGLNTQFEGSMEQLEATGITSTIPKENNSFTEIPMTETWSLVTGTGLYQQDDCATAATGVSGQRSFLSELEPLADNSFGFPVPTPDVVTALQNLCRPDVQDYLQRLTAYITTRNEAQVHGDNDTHDSSSSYITLTNYQPHSRFDIGNDAVSRSHSSQSALQLVPNTSTPLRRSPRKKSQFSVCRLNDNMMPARVPESATSETSRPIPNDLEDTSRMPARVPESTSSETSRPIPNDLEDTSRVKLLENYETTVTKDGLRKAISAAKKSGKPGYTLCYKLLAEVFDLETMAKSKGQGLVKKEGDTRPVLNKQSVSAIKDYSVVWCKKNGMTPPLEATLNDAITERISYARKQIKAGLKKK